jgi:hypothetical protein
MLVLYIGSMDAERSHNCTPFVKSKSSKDDRCQNQNYEHYKCMNLVLNPGEGLIFKLHAKYVILQTQPLHQPITLAFNRLAVPDVFCL